MADTNWDYLLTLLPEGWQQAAKDSGAARRMRGVRSVSSLLRTLLLHVGHGCSLRTTATLAKACGWAALSDVALLKRLRASEEWLRQLCSGLLKDSSMSMPAPLRGLRMRLVDGTVVCEPGDTGAQWRVLYSLRVPDWQCDFFRLTPAKGKGNGESLSHYTIKEGDCLIADRGFSHLSGIEHVRRAGGHVIVRLQDQNTPLEHEDGGAVDLLPWLRALKAPGQIASQRVWLRAPTPGAPRVEARICAVRKSVEASALAQRKTRHRARRKGQQIKAATVELSSWVVVLTTVEASHLGDAQVLDWYRVRWQIELAFKRLKSLADVGHLPKRDAASSRAWVYGKLLIALLTEKMQRHAAAISPWGGRWLDQDPPPEPLA